MEKKKRIALISFTRAGGGTAKRLLSGLRREYDCRLYIKRKYWNDQGKEQETEEGETEGEKDSRLEKEILDWTEKGEVWTKQRFQDSDGIIFVGAVGIAVRLIAPCVQDKMTDPAVVAVDEQGHFSIPLLSGHIGGANQLAAEAAELLGGQAVVTTATDLNQKFAIDLFAKQNGLVITDRTQAREISARILEGEAIWMFSDFPVKGKLPEEVRLLGKEEKERIQRKPDVWITADDGGKGDDCLVLIPKCVVIGIGCRKGVGFEKILERMEELCQNAGIDQRSICRIATIDRKAEEPGLLEAARKLGVEVKAFSREELEAVGGSFTESEFVKKTVGIGNVCERAAVLGAEGTKKEGTLIVEKTMGNGVTAAAAIMEKTIHWDMTGKLPSGSAIMEKTIHRDMPGKPAAGKERI